MERREVVKQMLMSTTALAVAPVASISSCDDVKNHALKGNINHSVCRWTYNFLTLDELCAAIKDIGFAAIDLVGPKDWNTLKDHGVFSSM